MFDGFMLDRRSLILGAGASLFATQALGGTASWREIAEIERQISGRVGVTAHDTGSGKRLSYRGGERFAMCSTFKWLLAAAVLSQVDQGRLSLDREISYGKADLFEYAPVAKQHVDEGHLSVAELCDAAVEFSDNTAANLLLGLIGGPAGFTRFCRDMGDPVTRLDRMEPALNSNIPGDPRDTTTPDAMTGLMAKILIGEVLSRDSHARLITGLKECKTGLARLRAGLPPDWVVGDKTGTGERGAANDLAIIWPPGRAPILVASCLSAAAVSGERRNQAHAQIGRVVAAAF